MCFCPGTLRGPEARDCIFLGYNFNGEQIISEGVFNFFHPFFSLDCKEYECSLRKIVHCLVWNLICQDRQFRNYLM